MSRSISHEQHEAIAAHACRVYGPDQPVMVRVGRMSLGPFPVLRHWGCRVEIGKVAKLEFYGKTKSGALEAARSFLAVTRKLAW